MIRKLARHLLRILPDALGFRLVLSLVGRTQHVQMSPIESAAISRAKRIRYGDDAANTAFEWGTGPLIVLVHGFGGRAAQTAPLAVALAARGYKCVAIDVTGHGDTKKRFTRWSYFLRDIEALSRSLRSEVFAYVCHSAGGLTMMATRQHGRIKAQKYVCVCAPSYPFPPINAVRAALSPSPGVMTRYKEYLGAELGMPWKELESGGSYKGAGSDLLLIYDERDRFIAHTEGDRIHSLCSGSTLIKTRDYSHQRILAAPELPAIVHEFLERE
jgi:hypothetical protein